MSSGAEIAFLALSNSYTKTTNPTHCSLTFLLKDLTGTTYSSSSSPVKIDSTGNVYITKNSGFNLTFYIIVTFYYTTLSVNSYQTNYF